jgi:hypothetical protein
MRRWLGRPVLLTVGLLSLATGFLGPSVPSGGRGLLGKASCMSTLRESAPRAAQAKPQAESTQSSIVPMFRCGALLTLSPSSHTHQQSRLQARSAHLAVPGLGGLCPGHLCGTRCQGNAHAFHPQLPAQQSCEAGLSAQGGGGAVERFRQKACRRRCAGEGSAHEVLHMIVY